MKYPEKFVTAALIKMDSEELSALSDALWADWQRVNNAFVVVKDMEERIIEDSKDLMEERE